MSTPAQCKLYYLAHGEAMRARRRERYRANLEAERASALRRYYARVGTPVAAKDRRRRRLIRLDPRWATWLKELPA